MPATLFTAGVAICTFTQLVYAQAEDYTQYVNVFRGTTNGGNMFPGVVAAPYAVVKLGPDLYTGSDSYSGYQPTGNITGFSMMHESGTGGAPKYGVVAQMPVSGSLDFPEVDLEAARGAPDNASVGYYMSTLESGITVELAGTDHAAMFQYAFPSGAEKHVVVDVGHYLPSFRGLGWSQSYLDGKIDIMPDGHYQGHGSYNGGWNVAPKWTIYFCGYFEESFTTAYTFKGNETLLSEVAHSNSSSGEQVVGGIFTFVENEVHSRVGISWISAEKACEFVNDEIPAGTELETLVENSKNAWNQQVLSKIITTGTTALANLQQLYSNLYGMFLIPSNRTGENPKWPANNTDVYYDDIFTYWDLHRCSIALTQLITPTSHSEQMQSLVNIYKYEGWMPDARSSNENGETQGGSNADNVLADAYVKGVQGVDWAMAYQALKKDATVTPPNNRDPRAPDSSTREGRGALPDWLEYEYITPNFSRSVSRGIEYAANDFSVYQIANGLDKNHANVYLERSRNWRNYWNPAQTSQIGGQNFSGFLVPRYANGSFEYPYDPTQCGGCYWKDPYYEALPWEYLFASRNHDMAYFINISGGPSTFVPKLETIFTFGLYSGNSQFNNTLVNPGNEPSFNSPYLFNFAGRQDLTVKHSRYINTAYYNAGTGGIPGNSDAGAMQSYQLWNMIGLYPLVSTPNFLISAPWFSSMTINLDDDASSSRKLTVTSTGQNEDPSIVTYVQSLKVNGQPWTKSWVSWEDVFENGGTMDFVMGSEPVNWATGELPPSPAS